MGLAARLTRLCKADIHGVMDQIEDKHLVLKQCLREMEEALDQKQARLNYLKAYLERIHREKKQLKGEHEKLEEDLAAAIRKERDDIARMLIKKLKVLEHHLSVIDLNGSTLDKEIAGLVENLEIQKHQYAELQLRSETCFHQEDPHHPEAMRSAGMPNTEWSALTDEEIELELMKRKEAMKGGQ